MTPYRAPILVASMLVLGLAACGDDGAATSDGGAGVDGGGGAVDGGPGRTDGSTGGTDAGLPDLDVTVTPARIDDVLTNPNMGFADFHFGWICGLPPTDFTPGQCAERARGSHPEGYPETAVAYFRWHWSDVEPVRGEIDFELIDRTIQSANLLGETLGFRVMTIAEGGAGVPDWLLEAPYDVEGSWIDGTFWPDYRDATFQAEHQRLLQALGDRYDDHPGVDHVDIGTVGCWGEWNTACLSGAGSIIDVYSPASDAERDEIAAAYESLVDHHVEAFPTTPVVMLGIGSGGGRELDVFVHAMESGAGWRVDCWGDWGWFGDSWSHHDDLYPALITNATEAYPAFPDVWQHAPVQLEVCGTMEGWHDRGWSAEAPDGRVHRAFEWAVEQHAAVLNGKRTTVHADYQPALEDLLRRNGYRYVVDELEHASAVAPGGELVLAVTWSNRGVTPSYTRRTVAFRLRSADRTEVFESDADVRDWLPGTWSDVERFALPDDLPPGTYELELAILDRAGTAPDTAPLPPLELGMEGRGDDGWYGLSSLTVE